MHIPHLYDLDLPWDMRNQHARARTHTHIGQYIKNEMQMNTPHLYGLHDLDVSGRMSIPDLHHLYDLLTDHIC